MDRIVERPRLRETLAEIVAMHKQGTYDLPEVEEKETQAVHDLADMADDLEKRGIYAQNTAAAE